MNTAKKNDKRAINSVWDYLIFWAIDFLPSLGLPILFIVAIWIAPNSFWEPLALALQFFKISFDLSYIKSIGSIFLLAAAIVSYLRRKLFAYLDAEPQPSEQSRTLSLADKIENRFQKIDDQLEHLRNQTLNVTEADRQGLYKTASEKLTDQSIGHAISELEARAKENFSARMRDRTIRLQFSTTRQRLSAEIDALKRRGNANLFLGILITAAGVTTLVLTLTSSPIGVASAWDFFSHYFPRLTLVVLIELFAYFFLRLYKSNLDDVKYFQNELTNVEAKHVALQAVFFAEDKSLLAEIVKNLSNTERNHILKKGETTVELEKIRVESDKINSIIKETTSSLVSAFGRSEKRSPGTARSRG
ncbi:hypothetical protein LMG28614_06203 [Paraburkholderia ultramafica]|uniref:Uncharacterized protein n=1 Tax=Paraburkholderia ultramafica TaxID=1544867 RepID=A0A6S7CBL0_9BURK|nr:hypothetical protein [Paraburkholderia ultramafica]CAB3805416.1 hypothetical protein LMG28614_06203 [Paraburkholderia ultramafica]